MSTYTKEFEEFTKEARGRSELSTADKWDTHLMLSAFVKLVREESKKVDPSFVSCWGEAVGETFNALCERFGLEREG